MLPADRRLEFDPRKPLIAGGPGHNRWHPDIPPVLAVLPGETVVLDTWDGNDAQVTPASTTTDLSRLDFLRSHSLVGPILIEGTQPGDLLLVEVMDIVPDSFGFSFAMPGFGPVGDLIPEPLLVRWTITDNVARSDDLPGIAIVGVPFVGVVGVAPSPERMREFTRRERALAERGGTFFGRSIRVTMPTAQSAVPAVGPPATEGLRTGPPRETGGNLDVKNLTAGARVALAVDLPGSLCSIGDVHFAQGDGECAGPAIEMAARVRVRFNAVRAADRVWRQSYPSLTFTEPARLARTYFSTTGLPIRPDGENEYLDLTLAARHALEEMLGYLTAERGYSVAQAAVIASVAVDLRISEMVDAPNALVSAVLPLEIFDR